MYSLNRQVCPFCGTKNSPFQADCGAKEPALELLRPLQCSCCGAKFRLPSSLRQVTKAVHGSNFWFKSIWRQSKPCPQMISSSRTIHRASYQSVTPRQLKLYIRTPLDKSVLKWRKNVENETSGVLRKLKII